jgi:hypothetical protein
MLKRFIFVLAIAAGGALLPQVAAAAEFGRALGITQVDQNITQVQGRGYGGGYGPRRTRCRMVRGEPGSGMGPQRVCEPVVEPQCRTVVVPGSGRGPQTVCE